MVDRAGDETGCLVERMVLVLWFLPVNLSRTAHCTVRGKKDMQKKLIKCF